MEHRRASAVQAYLRPMQVAATRHRRPQRELALDLSYVWLAGLAVYCVAIFVADKREAMWINNIAWTLGSGAAALACFHAARRADASRRRAWFMFGLGCTSWFAGTGALGLQPARAQGRAAVPEHRPGCSSVPSPCSPSPRCCCFRRRSARRAFTLKHVGNLGLVLCCLAVTVVLGMLEPALQINVPAFFLWIALVHTLLVAATFLTALYALWTFRWGAAGRRCCCIVFATLIYAVANLFYAHSLLTGSYLPGRSHQCQLAGDVRPDRRGRGRTDVAQQTRPRPTSPKRMQARERWLEAVVPALLIIIMVIVAVSSAATLTPRVHGLVGGPVHRVRGDSRRARGVDPEASRSS